MSCQPLCLMRSISENIAFTSSTWSVTMSQNPARSLGVMGNGSSSACVYRGNIHRIFISGICMKKKAIKLKYSREIYLWWDMGYINCAVWESNLLRLTERHNYTTCKEKVHEWAFKPFPPSPKMAKITLLPKDLWKLLIYSFSMTGINGRFWRKLNFSLCFTFLRISPLIM